MYRVASEKQYESIKKGQVVHHSILDGTQEEQIERNCYRISVRAVKQDFACNFETLIC